MKLIEIFTQGHGLIHINPDQIVAIEGRSESTISGHGGECRIYLGSMIDFVTVNSSSRDLLGALHHMGILEEIAEVGDCLKLMSKKLKP